VTEESTAYIPPPVVGEKWLTCNGRQLRKMARAGLATLEENHQKVNDLNVFPVPDGDTGINMLLTMRAACRRIQDDKDLHVGQVAQDLSQGALMGARGNSGVILSQIWRGLAKSLKDKETFNAEDLALALQLATDTAYKGVMRPVEGTILTVVREGAEEAQEIAERIRVAVEERPFLIDKSKNHKLTISLGVATYPDCAKSAWDLLIKADQAMYHVKETGRNRVHVAPKLSSCPET